MGLPESLAKPKFIRDPIHDIIRIQPKHRFILELLDSRPMQRLRAIRQLGLAYLVYPGAEHSRFVHSLGVYHLAGRVMAQLEEAAETQLFDDHCEPILAAALLHDVGHGPFSHIFEAVSRQINPSSSSHEAWSARIIKEHGPIHDALTAVADDLPDKVVQLITHTYQPHYASAIISSQLDVDRFDYLLRDSLMTGAHYGAFDLEWLLRTLTVRSVPTVGDGTASLETIVVDGQRGLSGLEAHMIGRHYMYRHVYFHKAIRSAERMLDATLRRAAKLVQDGDDSLANSAFVKLARQESLDVADYLSLNDFVVMAWIEEWAHTAKDKILTDLARRLINRRLFKAVLVLPGTPGRVYADNRSRLTEIVKDHNFDPAYYLLEDGVDNVAYKDYFHNLERGRVADEEEIWYVDPSGRPSRLSANEESVLTGAARVLRFHEDRWFVPEDVARRAQSELRWE